MYRYIYILYIYYIYKKSFIGTEHYPTLNKTINLDYEKY